MPITLNFDGMSLTLSDDKALEVVAQIGQLLTSKKKVEPRQPVQRRTFAKRRNYSPRGKILMTRNGVETKVFPVYKTVSEMTPGTVFKSADMIEKFGKPATFAIASLEKRRKLRRVKKGEYMVA